ncbi:hypothetical protein [Azospirillum argentinense]|uniref:SDR family NAD(P)-dependent oxidoreductase n=1 Tax=Azospirillum argentinense TaxID=2970906 RepID=UPI0032DE40F1
MDIRDILERTATLEISEDEAVTLLQAALTPPAEPPAEPATGLAADAAVAGSATDGPRNAPGDAGLRIAFEAVFAAMAGDLLGIAPDDLDLRRPVADYGLNSIIASEFTGRLQDRFGIELSPTVLFEFRDLRGVVAHVVDNHGAALIRAGLGAAPAGAAPAPASVLAEPPLRPRREAGPAAGDGFDMENLWRNAEERAGSPVPPPVAPPPVPARAPLPAAASATASTTAHGSGVAVVGMAAVLPGSPDLGAFWGHLAAGTDLVDAPAAERGLPGRGALIADVDRFDAAFFRISPREAAAMDPQQRLLLQAVWHALEDAAITPSSLAGTSTGVFVGIATTDYLDLSIAGSAAVDPFMATGMAHSIAANRISHTLDLKGPSEVVNTACSSVLVALHNAVRALAAGDCTMAIVGGANLVLHDRVSDAFRKAGMLSASGRCRPFAAGADGFVRGEGVGAVVLKPVDKALADGDPIHGVILGSAVNHGGRAGSLTSPSSEAQTDVLVRAYADAGIDPASITCIEAYGIGSELGDRVEAEALVRAFATLRRQRGAAPPDQPHCVVGSVKSNVGSLETASGIAALAKVLLSMRHGRIPASLHLDRVNPAIDLRGTPFRLAAEATAWPVATDPATGRPWPRRAGISSFGFGGANGHVVVEEPPPMPAGAGSPGRGPQVIVLSARSGDRLDAQAAALLDHLDGPDSAGHGLADIAWTLQAGREALEHRLAFVARDMAELRAKLRGLRDGTAGSGIHRGTVNSGTTDGGRDDGPSVPPATGPDAVAARWVAGGAVDWAALHRGTAPRRLRLPGYPFARTRHWFKVAGAAPASDPRPAAAGAEGGNRLPTLDAPAYRTLVSRLEEVCIWLLGAAFRAMGVFVRPGESHDPARLRRSIGLVPAAEPVFDALIGRLIAGGLLRRDGERIAAAGIVDAAPAPWPVDEDAFLAGHPPELHAHLRLARHGALAIPDILAGRTAASDVLFPDGTLRLVEPVYQGGALTRPFNEAVARTIRERLEETPDGALSVLEIGAGTGATTEPVLEALAPWGRRVRYVYTDVSRGFLRHGRQRFARSGAELVFQTLDIERDPAAQGFEPGSFDVVVASNVLHATSDVRAAVGHAKALLKPGGRLVLCEATAAQTFLAITFGLLDGWWLWRDRDLRLGGSPLLDVAGWRRVLAERGFHGLRVTGDGQGDAHVQCILAADSDGVIEPSAASPPVAEPAPPAPVAEPSAALRDPLVQAIRARILDQVCRSLDESAERIDTSRPFFEYGLDSFVGSEVVAALAGELGVSLKPTVLFEHASIDRLSRHLGATHGAALAQRLGIAAGTPAVKPAAAAVSAVAAPLSSQSAPSQPASSDIAVIGMAGRFPGAASVEAFWEMLDAGRCAIGEVPPDRWPAESHYDPDPRKLDRTYTTRGGFLDAVDLFDAEFFNITGREAELSDPQHRLFLEQAWAALEDAGYARPGCGGLRCGVFVGAGGGDYLTWMIQNGVPMGAQSFWGNTSSVLAARISYLLDLDGPSLAVETACSSSLVAIHLGCQSLLAGETDIVLAGGAFLNVTPTFHILASNGRMLAPDGRCKAFDAGADGFVAGEAVAAVVLKPLARAVADGDNILGVIKATGVNQDGRTNGITAPNPLAQAALTESVYRRFGIDPGTIGSVEAHGTGTSLGDPIEVEALTRSFRAFTDRRQFCALGSVKTNIGHAATAAGITGFVKALLSLTHRRIPASLNFERPNEQIDFASSPFFVNTVSRDWPAGGGPRRAAVSSFGFSGTNAHVVIEEAPALPDRPAEQPWSVLPVSARKPEALRRRLADLRGWLDGPGAAVPMADIARTLQVGRMHFAERAALVVRDHDHLRGLLDAVLERGTADLAWVGRAAENAALGAVCRQLVADLRTPDLDEAARREKASALAQLYVIGSDPDWERLNEGSGARFASLPTYPLSRSAFRAAAGTPVRPPASPPVAAGEGGVTILAAEARWQDAPPVPPADGRDAGPVWLFDADDRLAGDRLAGDRLAGGLGPALLVTPGTALRHGGGRAEIDPADAAHYRSLIQDAVSRGAGPAAIVVAWAGRLPTDPAVQGIHAVRHILRAVIDAGHRDLVRLLFVWRGTEDSADAAAAVFDAVAAYAPSVKPLLPNLGVTCLRVDPSIGDAALAARLCGELASPEPEVAYRLEPGGGEGGTVVRRVRTLAVLGPVSTALAPSGDGVAIRTGGVYLITGGAGALGRIMARHLAARGAGQVVLVGRSAPEAVSLEELAGPVFSYRQADVTDAASLGAVVAEVVERFGALHGVIHAAGAFTGRPLTAKTPEEFAATLAPKLDGTVALDRATADLPLDFFAVFSSVSAELGDFGQCDYAVANRFQSAWGLWREGERQRGRRQGRTLSIGWPLWRDGGMHTEAAAEDLYLRTAGLAALESAEGAELFDRVLRSGRSNVLLLKGEPERAARLFATRGIAGPRRAAAASLVASALPPTAPAADGAPIADRLRRDILHGIAQSASVPVETVERAGHLGDLGLDSLMLSDLADRLNAGLGIALSPTTFFSHGDLDSLTRHILAEWPAVLDARYAPPAPASDEAPVEAPAVAAPVLSETPPPRSEPSAPLPGAAPDAPSGAIAIVGMSGRFPGSPDIDGFWRNLEACRDLIGEIPAERWDWRRDYGGPEVARGRSVSRWGGFIEGADRFEADFFGLSPSDALRMAPQERLFLETCWKAVEDAGYRASALAGRRVAVFAGAQIADSQSDLCRPAHLAERVARFFDLRGSAEVLDTACSSSLVAVDRAVRLLRDGECEMALAGGVSLITSAEGMIAASQMGILSPRGRCRTFDATADGFVKGEGVCVLVLKPLAAALADGDHVHGVILGSAVNHGGKATSLTAPNAQAQAALIEAAVADAGIGADAIGFLELHGTGTRLGDPVEIDGIRTAFARMRAGGSDAPESCGIGSVKTNIGHLEPAAGIAGIVKVVMAMRHGTLPGTPNLDQVNPLIQLSGTPFRIVRGTQPWPADGRPRRAGVSSFGFGGTNAHVVIGETPRTAHPPVADAGPWIFPLAARDDAHLRALARDVAAFIERAGDDLPALRDISHTLTTGREPMAARLAVIAGDRRTLAAALRGLPETGALPAVCGTTGSALDAAARRWAAGGAADWTVTGARRVPLPSYPFAGARYPLIPETPTMHTPAQLPVQSQARPVPPVPVEAPRPAAAPTAVIPAAAPRPGRIALRPAAGSASPLPSPAVPPPAVPEPRRLPAGAGAKAVSATLSGILRDIVHLDQIAPAATFAEMGVDSISGVEIIREVNRAFGLELDAAALYDHPTPAALEAALEAAIGVALESALETALPAPAAVTPVVPAPPAPSAPPPADLDAIPSRLSGILRDIVHLDRIVPAATFAEMGVDSISGVEIIREVNRAFGLELDAAALYDHPTPAALADALRGALAARHPSVPAPIAPVAAPVAAASPAAEPARPQRVQLAARPIPAADRIQGPVLDAHPPARARLALRPGPQTAAPVPVPVPRVEEPAAAPPVQAAPVRAAVDTPIAVIGLSCRFPGAPDADHFWRNLMDGVDSVGEVPAERWDATGGSRRAGCLDGIDRFDAAFFNISPLEAEMINPEQRLFLEESWKALENAGYGDRALAGSRCGVFVGANTGDYARLVGSRRTAHALTGLSNSVLAGRIAYFLDLQGPSVAVDSACSSSLVSIALACRGIAAGDCDMALAGGVFLMVTPDLNVVSGKAGVLSPTGRCRSFDAAADGIVMGEGVGVVVLKALDRALADGDPIHGVIRGIACNQDGKTNGISAPSARSQARLIREVHRRAGIDPRAVSYVEAHGTGTALGDPIEIKGLTEAFGAAGDRAPHPAGSIPAGSIPIGSVKTNIGHSNMAAGVAAVIKVLLALKHRKLPPSLHYTQPNPHIDFADSPFRVCTAAEDWTPPAGHRRMAAVSSFGFSGTNAHAVIEEAPERPVAGRRLPLCLVPLSAKTGPALQRRAADLAAWLEGPGRDAALEDVAVTLSAGRSHFAVRAALVVRDRAELVAGLGALADGRTPDGGFRHDGGDGAGVVPNLPAGLPVPAADRAALERLADAYVHGFDPDWTALFDGVATRRIALPTYPFAGDRHWIAPEPAAPLPTAPSLAVRSGDASDGAGLVPDFAASLDGGLSFLRRIPVDDPLVRDHRVLGRGIVPGVGYLELAHAAAARVLGDRPLRLSRVHWLQPMEVSGAGAGLRVTLSRREDGLSFAITSFTITSFAITGTGEGEQPVVHARGEIRPLDVAADQAIDVETLKRRLPRTLDGARVYEDYSRLGVDYAGYFRGIGRVWGSRDESLVELLPVDGGGAGRPLHPGPMDSALQGIAGFVREEGGTGVLLPFSVDAVDVLRATPSGGFAHLRLAGPQRFDVTLLDREGRPCVRMADVTLRPVRDPLEGFFYRPGWVERPAGERPWRPEAVSGPRRVLVIRSPEGPDLGDALRARHPGDDVTVLVAGEPDFDGVLRRRIAQAAPDRVYHLSGVAPGTAEEAIRTGDAHPAQERGLLSLFRTVKALGEAGLATHPLRLGVLTADVHDVTGDERLNPMAAGLHGLAKAVAKEFGRWQVACLDVSRAETDPARWLDALDAEPPLGRGEDVALRGGRRYVRVLEAARLEPVRETPWRVGGTYLIVGGAGGIGVEISRHLAARARAKLVWVGRGPLDERRRRLAAEIEAAGGEVLYVQADIARGDGAVQAVEQARRRFGTIHGVIHSALVLEDRTLQNMSEDAFLAALGPKLHGAVRLQHALGGAPLDVMMFFSSAQSFEGSAGQSNYAAASTFNDAFARWLARKAGYPVRIVNWGYWGTVGVVASSDYARRMAALGLGSITPRQGADAVDRVLAHDEVQVMAVWASEELRRSMTGAAGEAAVPTLAIESPAVDEGQLLGYERASRALDGLAARLVHDALRRMGAFAAPDAEETVEGLFRRLGILPSYRRLFDGLIDILLRAGLCRLEDGRLRGGAAVGSPDEPPDSGRAALAEAVARFGDEHPVARPHVTLLRACVDAYPEVLTGRRGHMDVMFPQGRMDLLEGIYRGDCVADYFHRLAASAAAGVVGGSTAERPLVVEIGAGTGGTSAFVLERLAALGRPLRYLYTDLSKAFTDHGRTRFAAAYPFLEFAELDVDRDDGIAAVPEGSADAVIASNVLHATRDIRRTLDRVRRLLKPGGVLILNEGCRIRDFATLTFGLTGGWWAFDDPAERIPHTPLLDEAGWRRILDGQGFSGVRCFDLPDGKPGRGTQIVLLASRDAASQPAGAVPPPATAAVPRAADAAVPGTGGETDGAGLPGRVTDYVRGVLGEVLKIDPAQIRTNQTFEVHGVDSLVALTINGRFEQDLGPVPATLLFEHPTAAKLADHLLATHGETLARLLSPAAAPAPAPVEPLPVAVSASPAPISPTSIPPAPAAPSSVAPSSVALAQAARSNQPRRRPDERSRSAMRARVENLPDDKVEQLLRQMLGRRSLR